MQHISRQIHKHLQTSQRAVIVIHQNPDGDALGSAAAFLEYLESMQITADIFCTTAATQKLNYLPHYKKINNDINLFKNPTIDTIIVLDTGDLRYAGIAAIVKNHSAVIINIDHHPTNENYGYFNLVNPLASSTAEIIFHFFKHNHLTPNHRQATALLSGLITDTSNFTNSATNPIAMQIAGELTRAGGNLNLVNIRTNQDKSLASLKLWGLAFNRLTHWPEKDLVYTYLTQKDFTDTGATENESEGIANFLNNLNDVAVILILKETADGKTKGSFRTTKNEIDVSLWAKNLGGGGHKKAAGFTIEGTTNFAWEKIKNILQNQS